MKKIARRVLRTTAAVVCAFTFNGTFAEPSEQTMKAISEIEAIFGEIGERSGSERASYLRFIKIREKILTEYESLRSRLQFLPNVAARFPGNPDLLAVNNVLYVIFRGFIDVKDALGIRVFKAYLSKWWEDPDLSKEVIDAFSANIDGGKFKGIRWCFYDKFQFAKKEFRPFEFLLLRKESND